MTTTTTNSNPGMISKLRTITMGLSIAGLVCSNVATLAFETYHDTLHSFLRRGLEAVATPWAEGFARSSTKAMVESKVQKATKAISEESRLLKAKAQTAEKQLEEVARKHTKAAKEVEELTAKHLHNSKFAKTVAGSVQKRLAKGVVRNTASIPAEGIPYIGLGVVLSVTALDIYDACETAKEINALLKLLGQGEENTDFCGAKVPTPQEAMRMAATGWKESVEYVRSEAVSVSNKTKVFVPEVRLPTVKEASAYVCPIVKIPGAC